MIRVGAVADIPDGEAVVVQGEVPIAVFRVDDGDDVQLFAIDDTCSHQKASLSEGWVEDCKVECPLHAACFDLRTGMPSGPPAKMAVRTYPVVVTDGIAFVNPALEPAAATVPAVPATLVADISAA